MNVISIYEGTRTTLIKERQKTNDELNIIQAAGADMDNKTSDRMDELIDYLVYLGKQMDTIDKYINDAKKGF